MCHNNINRITHSILEIFMPVLINGNYASLHLEIFMPVLINGNYASLHLSPGKEFGCGVYISSVLHSSKAAQCGLKV